MLRNECHRGADTVASSLHMPRPNGMALSVLLGKDDKDMQTLTSLPDSPTVTHDDLVCGLAVYSRDFVPLGQIADVPQPDAADEATFDGRRLTIDPNPTVRHVLGGEDLIVSESMIGRIDQAEDRVILNLSARRLIRSALQGRERNAEAVSAH